VFINTFGNREVKAEINPSNFINVTVSEEINGVVFIRKISGMGYNEFMNFTLNKDGRKEFKKYLSMKGLEPNDISMSSDKTQSELFVEVKNKLVKVPDLAHWNKLWSSRFMAAPYIF